VDETEPQNPVHIFAAELALRPRRQLQGRLQKTLEGSGETFASFPDINFDYNLKKIVPVPLHFSLFQHTKNAH
jgi:hypothetical protein